MSLKTGLAIATVKPMPKFLLVTTSCLSVREVGVTKILLAEVTLEFNIVTSVTPLGIMPEPLI